MSDIVNQKLIFGKVILPLIEGELIWQREPKVAEIKKLRDLTGLSLTEAVGKQKFNVIDSTLETLQILSTEMPFKIKIYKRG